MDAEPAPVEPEPPVEPEKTSVDAAVTKTEIAPSLARLERDLATAEAKIRVLETLAYCAVAGLIVFLVIAASLLLAWRKRASATRAQVYRVRDRAGTASLACSRWPGTILRGQ